VPTFADRWLSRSQSGEIPYGRNLGFLELGAATFCLK
jgi:hypothetical protein